MQKIKAADGSGCLWDACVATDRSKLHRNGRLWSCGASIDEISWRKHEWRYEYASFMPESKYLGKLVSVNENFMNVTKTKKEWENGSAVVLPHVKRGISRWRFRVESGAKATLGIVTSDFDAAVDGYINKTEKGWCYYQENGKKGHAGPARDEYGKHFKDPGAVVTVQLDFDKNELRFFLNNESFGPAYKKLPKSKKGFCAAVSLYNKDDSVTLLSFERWRRHAVWTAIGDNKNRINERFRRSVSLKPEIKVDDIVLLSSQLHILRSFLQSVGGSALTYFDKLIKADPPCITASQLLHGGDQRMKELGIRKGHVCFI